MNRKKRRRESAGKFREKKPYFAANGLSFKKPTKGGKSNGSKK